MGQGAVDGVRLAHRGFRRALFGETNAQVAAKDNGDVLRITKVGSVKVYEVSPPGEKQFFVALLDGKALVATPNQEIMNETVARAAAGKQGGQKKEFKELLKTISAKQSLHFVY